MSQDQLTETARSTGTVSTDIESAVRRIVDAAPPLTAEQRDRLAVLLRGAGAGK